MIIYNAPGGSGAAQQFWELAGVVDDTIINSLHLSGGVEIVNDGPGDSTRVHALFRNGAQPYKIEVINNTTNETGNLRYDVNGAPGIGDIQRLQIFGPGAIGVGAVEVTQIFAQLQTDQTTSLGQKVEARVVSGPGAANGTFQVIGNNVIVFFIRQDGRIHTNQTVPVVPLAATSRLLPVYDEFAVFLGYAEIKLPL